MLPGKRGDILSATVNQLQLLIDMLTDAFLCGTTEGKVIGCNNAACQLFGYSREEMLDLSRYDLADNPDRIRAPRERAGSARATMQIIRKGGERIEADVTSIVVKLEEGETQVWTVIRDLADRRRADLATAALRESNEMLSALTDAAFEAVVVHRGGTIIRANRAAEALANVPPGELTGRKLFDFIAPGSHDLARAKITAGDEEPYEAFGRRSDGTVYPAEIRARNAPVQVGGAPARVVALRDLTARKQLEEEFRQAQKMEAVGRLAGGVAHDFNNMLVVIQSSVELAAETLPPDHPAAVELDEVRRAARRAQELTRDLLALSRKQLLRVSVVEVGAVIEEMRSLVGRLVGEDIELVGRAKRTGMRAKLDSAQLELLIMNLVVNARDAMPKGGTLTLAVERATFDDQKGLPIREMTVGHHVKISVRDTGTGMDDATKSRIFEPFFTTKAPGRGTGLGLSTVFGIVKQSGGAITVESTPGTGTTFAIYFPSTEDDTTATPADTRKSNVVAPSATILVVEDEFQVRRVVVLSLRGAGYEVIEAGRPDEAIELARNFPGKIDLLLTDVVMPQMSGRHLSEKILASRSSIRVLFVSGYTEDSIVEGGVLEPGVLFLQKPFTGSRLLEMVASVLG